MRLLYYTKPPFFDYDLPYLSEQKSNIKDIYTIIDLPPYFLQSSLLNIHTQIPNSGIYKASLCKEFKIFKDTLNLDKTYIVNRINKKVLNIPNLILNVKLFLFIWKLRPTIIHSSIFYDFQELLLYFFRKKTILTVHDPFPHSGENNLRKTIFRKVGFRLLNNFVLLNEIQKTQFVKSNKMECKNVYTSKLGIYTAYNLYSNSYYEKLPLKYILFFGRISPYKGINILLDAMKKVHQIHPEVHIIIAGNGKYYFDKTKYENLHYVEFRNRYIPNEELVELIKGSLFIVCPYIDATQSGVIMTSYAFCKPVIASNVGGLSEMVIDKVTGILIEPNSIIDLEKAINQLLIDDETLHIMEKNILNHFHFGDRGWDKISKELMEIYRKINSLV
jgi:glycosyltransferase involved in cell wall biosynthesis